MHHIVSLSGGSASAVAADRVLKKYGSENTTLWFADTLWEDEDLYRFLEDLEKKWDKKIVRFTDGRTPLQVAEDKNIIPNSLVAPCSYFLKQVPFRNYIKEHPKPLTVHLGLDWSEQHRHAKPKEIYEKIEGVTVDFPLMWKPVPFMDYTAMIGQQWGIPIPRLYRMGFSHNNCGGRCVRAGASEWVRLLKYFPDRYKAVEEWELDQQTKDENRENRTIQKEQINNETVPISLKDLRIKNETTQIDMFENDGDAYGCFCEY
jgi:3'-phosphoadenosine 5'-phosphosulfate sulfotransferase (PAPS reductase)/FAD synthetase